MGKRYADTNLHRKVWFRKLSWALRESWRILCAECDVIGVWEIDVESLNLWLDVERNGHHRLTLEDLTAAFDLQIIDEDKVWIPGFVPFQYGDEAGVVSWKNKLRSKITRMLTARGLPLPQFKDIPHTHNGYPPSVSDGSPTHGGKEEEEEIEQVEDKVISSSEEGSGEKPEVYGDPPIPPTLEAVKRGIPLITQEKWKLEYPDPPWLEKQISRCFDFHTAELAKMPRTRGQWAKKLMSWLDNNWAERQAKLDPRAKVAAEIDAKIRAKWGGKKAEAK